MDIVYSTTRTEDGRSWTYYLRDQQFNRVLDSSSSVFPTLHAAINAAHDHIDRIRFEMSWRDQR